MCSTHLASLRCQAKPGHFYDALLKACLPCVELCGTRGRHPAECAHVCEAPPTSGGLTQAALQSSTTRGSSLTKGEHHAAAIYCLLGLCLAALFCTLAVTLLVLLRKAKGQADQWGHRAGPKDQENSDDSLRPSSKDRLLDAVVGGQKRAWPTETCMHCFPQQQRGDDRPAFYQQATGTAPPSGASETQHHHRHQDAVAVATSCHGSLPVPGGKDGGLRIICSPRESAP
ncbi:tumor necrosis factor receptor superfamily member 13B [Conger conger]|uniref:tumor necrosis factor receptor superfamily member 13B n=1 Tax=Conger conger TaxID=82655 RepID=UPI002A5AEEE9|nr:tumor necrosis factor receptor superfamily member 13B [Conger conger]